MSTTRPLVTVFKQDGKPLSSIRIPKVFQAPLRPDLVKYVHNNISRNRTQPYAVKPEAGYNTSAESWGTGRAVARIPRVPGGGTQRAGQAAFGNMCRGGGMYNPTKIWRRWHRRININEKRHAVASAIAASGLPSLVMAKGHRINSIPELPLVVSKDIQSLQKTKEAISLLKSLGCGEDLQKVINSKTIRCGKGKSRNRRYVMRRGPLIIYSIDDGITRAFRNIPGVDLCHVDKLNLLKIAPGGNFGRLILWSESAFIRLEQLFGTYRSAAPLKKGYRLLRSNMTNPDLASIINSEAIQSAIRPALEPPKKLDIKRNPLKNKRLMERLSPGSLLRKAKLRAAQTEGTQEHKLKLLAVKKRIEKGKKNSKVGKRFFTDLEKAYTKDHSTPDDNLTALKILSGEE